MIAGALAADNGKMAFFNHFRAHQLKEGSILVELCATCDSACQGQQCDGDDHSRPHGCCRCTAKEKEFFNLLVIRRSECRAAKALAFARQRDAHLIEPNWDMFRRGSISRLNNGFIMQVEPSWFLMLLSNHVRGPKLDQVGMPCTPHS